jgi:hypothetical protein
VSKKYTIRTPKEGIIERDKKKPQFSKDEKSKYSKPTSTTFVNYATGYVPTFFFSQTNSYRVSVIIPAIKDHALTPTRIIKYNNFCTLTVNRFYDGHSVEELKSVKSYLYNNLDDLEKDLINQNGAHFNNECLVRLRFGEKAGLLIREHSNHLSDKLWAQLLASDASFKYRCSFNVPHHQAPLFLMRKKSPTPYTQKAQVEDMNVSIKQYEQFQTDLNSDDDESAYGDEIFYLEGYKIARGIKLIQKTLLTPTENKDNAIINELNNIREQIGNREFANEELSNPSDRSFLHHMGYLSHATFNALFIPYAKHIINKNSIDEESAKNIFLQLTIISFLSGNTLFLKKISFSNQYRLLQDIKMESILKSYFEIAIGKCRLDSILLAANYFPKFVKQYEEKINKSIQTIGKKSIREQFKKHFNLAFTEQGSVLNNESKVNKKQQEQDDSNISEKEIAYKSTGENIGIYIGKHTRRQHLQEKRII